MAINELSICKSLAVLMLAFLNLKINVLQAQSSICWIQKFCSAKLLASSHFVPIIIKQNYYTVDAFHAEMSWAILERPPGSRKSRLVIKASNLQSKCWDAFYALTAHSECQIRY